MAIPSHTAPRIFVSHSHHDNAFGVQLVTDLRRALGNDDDAVWYDVRGGLHGGDAWWRRIEDEITARPVFIVILSPEAVASKWVADELDLAWNQKNSDTGKLIIPILLRPCLVRPGLKLLHMISFESPQAYEEAFAELLAAIEVHLSAERDTTSQTPVRSLPPDHFPLRLRELGFTAHNVNGVEYILPPLCAIPIGDFLMGSDPNQDAGAYTDELPLHKVRLPAYAIGRFPVTVAEYACAVRQQVIKDQEHVQHVLDWAGQGKRLDYPVTRVTWYNARVYTEWLTSVTGQTWRLPSEAEWEKAARWDEEQLHSRIYPWGARFDPARCNTLSSGRETAVAIGSYPTNISPCGVQDMAGNTWQWTSSKGERYPYDPKDGRERLDVESNRVLRGGAWDVGPRYARSARRQIEQPRIVSVTVGFRLVCAAPVA
jgi:formylglycine-generating enzyme required for sulfatase activity